MFQSCGLSKALCYPLKMFKEEALPAAFDFAQENGVVILSFPPHCSHKLQALEMVGVWTFQGTHQAWSPALTYLTRSRTRRKPGRRSQKKSLLMKRNVSAWSVLNCTPVAIPRKYGLNLCKIWAHKDCTPGNLGAYIRHNCDSYDSDGGTGFDRWRQSPDSQYFVHVHFVLNEHII